MPFQMLFASLGIQISHEERKSFRKCITGNRYANNKKYNLNEQKIWNKTKKKNADIYFFRLSRASTSGWFWIY